MTCNEYKRLIEVSMNKNPCEWEKEDDGIKLLFLNLHCSKLKGIRRENFYERFFSSFWVEEDYVRFNCG